MHRAYSRRFLGLKLAIAAAVGAGAFIGLSEGARGILSLLGAQAHAANQPITPPSSQQPGSISGSPTFQGGCVQNGGKDNKCTEDNRKTTKIYKKIYNKYINKNDNTGVLLPANDPIPPINCEIPVDAFAIFIGNRMVAWEIRFPHDIISINGKPLLSIDKKDGKIIITNLNLIDETGQGLVSIDSDGYWIFPNSRPSAGASLR